MSRYNAALGEEGEYEPGSSCLVLKNKLGIRRKRLMDDVEGELLLHAREIYTQRISINTGFNAQMIREMHQLWLGEIYSWAGNYRTVEVAKGGFTWPPAIRVAQNMQQFETETLRKHTPCEPADLESVTASLAHVQAEFLLVHPFREGNGRMARWITDLMAQQAGYPELDYGFLGKGNRKRRETYLHAVQRGYLGDYWPLTRFLMEAISRALDLKE
jgi:cell filamentation protein